MEKLVKIGENEKGIFYKNFLTQDFGDGYKIVLFQFKDTGYREYLLLKDDKPVFNSIRIEDIWDRHDMLKDLEKRKELENEN
jgi:hypothetical protein